jgi:hypothetical protein
MKLARNTKLILLLVLICATFCTNTSTESEGRLKSGINISEKGMKKNKKYNENGYSDENISSNAMKAIKGAVDKKDGVDSKKNEGPIFHTQWIKYFKYVNTGDAKPKHFFKNGEFKEQYKYFPNADLTAKSDDGFGEQRSYIGSETDFYLTIFQHNINFLNSRQSIEQKVVDVLPFAVIDPIMEEPEDPRTPNDGIDDFGNFAEGFCFKVSANNKLNVWILCSETLELKEKLFKLLRDMKIQEQRSRGVYNIKEEDHTKQNTADQFMNEEKKKISSSDRKVADVRDGYWITIQDWTPCNLKCGGGEEVFQRLCVPPKDGGRPCEGESIIRRPCNTQPCQQIGETDNPGDITHNNTETLKAIVKVMPFSTRPQRFSKCVIKESDMMYENSLSADGNNPNLSGPAGRDNMDKIQIPVRVIMNNRTLSIYGGEDYSTQIIAMDLEYSNFMRETHNPDPILKKCFSIVSPMNKQKASLCPFSRGDDKSVDEWEYDFNLFKNQCQQSREKLEMEFRLNNKLQDKIKQAKREILEEREAEIKKKSGKSEIDIIQDKKRDTKTTALRAIQKELDLEEMIKKEEEEREKLEEEEVFQRIDEEKKKNDCLLKAIKEKALENQFKKKLDSEKKEIQSLEDTTRAQVGSRIAILKQKIWEMRNSAKERKQGLMQQLQEVRLSMADNLQKAYKKGEVHNCEFALTDQKNSLAYCTANFGSNPNTYSGCIGTLTSQRAFCKHCCRNEFGNLLEQEQNNCVEKVCKNLTHEPIKGGDNDKGVWVYQEAVKKSG